MRSGLSKLQVVSLVVVVGGALVAAVYGAWTYWGAGAMRSPFVAEIGSHGVTREQLRLRQAHANVYYPGSGTPEVALAQLIQGYLSAELMKLQNVGLDRKTWLAEEQRIDSQTRDPATLAKVKFVYGNDHDAYLYVGILPDFAQSRIYRLYRSSPAFAEEAREQASAFLDQAEKSPDRFIALAEEAGAHPRRLRVDARKGLVPVDREEEDDAGSGRFKDASPKSAHEMQLRADMEAEAGAREVEAARRLLERIASLSDGQVYRNTLEAPEAFEAVRLVERLGADAAIVEMAAFFKPDFGKWFWREAGKVPVRVHDEALKTRFVQEVSWAKHLNLF